MCRLERCDERERRGQRDEHGEGSRVHVELNGGGDRQATDIHLKARARVSGATLVLALHDFRTDVEGMLSGAGNSRDLGREVDLVVTKKMTPGFKLQIGGGVFVPGDLTK